MRTKIKTKKSTIIPVVDELETVQEVKVIQPKTVKVLVPTDRFLESFLQLASLCQHSVVLQAGKQGFYIQEQQAEESDSAASSGISLKWHPITGVYNNPVTAVSVALEFKLTGKTNYNYEEPPSPVNEEIVVSDDIKETLHWQLENAIKNPMNPTLNIPAVSMAAGGLGDQIRVRVIGRSYSWLFCEGTEQVGNLVFNLDTGATTDELYRLTKSVLKAVFNVPVTTEFDKPIQLDKALDDVIDVDVTTVDDVPEGQTAEEFAEMQKPIVVDHLIGLEVTADRAIESKHGKQVTGTLCIGPDYKYRVQAKGSKPVLVVYSTIKAVEVK